jgi:hypothetical protein
MNENLSMIWIYRSLKSLNEKIEDKYFPEYLDESSKNYIKRVQNLKD